MCRDAGRLPASELFVAADDDKAIPGPDPSVGWRVEGHGAVGTLHTKNHHTGRLTDGRIGQRFSNQGGMVEDTHLADFDVQALGAEGGVDEIEDVGAKEKLGDA